LIQDDEYNGYHIPKGSVMHPLEWAIARDPEMFPDPETFNPLRWVKPGYPTYKEPLTQYPTIINSTQFGYGRRVCQGQGVADEDMLIGIGSIAWLFNINRLGSDNVPVASPKPTENNDLNVYINEKATVSSEELNTGVKSKEAGPTMEDMLISKFAYPGSIPMEVVGDGAQSLKDDGKDDPRTDQKHNPEKIDPTLDFTTLLIAKPLPFRFHLSIRDEKRAEKVRNWFNEGVKNGDYKESREFWGENQGMDKPLGWGKV